MMNYQLTSGKMTTAHTAKECPVKVMLHFLLTQTLAVQSQDPEIIVPNLTKNYIIMDVLSKPDKTHLPTNRLVTFSA